LTGGWKEIQIIKDNPNPSYEIVAKALKLDTDTVSGMLSGTEADTVCRQRTVFGLTGSKAHFDTLFDTAFVIWRKKGSSD